MSFRKSSELQGAALDWAVAKCEGAALDPSLLKDGYAVKFRFEPSTNWAQGGPIIARERITLEWTGEGWNAYIRHDDEYPDGPTPLIAAMRCYVASKQGDIIDIPEAINETQ